MPSNPLPPPVTPVPVAAPSAPATVAAPPGSGFDPTPMINAQEQNLQDYLNQPVQSILDQLGLGPLPSGAAPPGAPLPPGQPGPTNPMDPSNMIQPVIDALGTLGTGMFDKLDPSKMFDGISKAFESAAGSVQQALGSLEGIWSGASGASAAAKTGETLANGTEVATQSAGLGANVTSTVADVKQAEARLIEIINEYNAKIAAIGPNIIFPWGQAQAVEAATQATTMTTEVITELQSTLAAQAGAATAIGAPVALTEAPKVGTEMIGVATGMVGPMMQAATQGLSMGVQTVAGAAQAGVETATGLASSLGAAASKATDPTIKASSASSIAPISKTSTGSGGSAGGGAGPSGVAPARALPQMSMPTTESSAATPTQANAARVATTPMGAGGMGGGGMMGAGHGAGKSGVGGQDHNAASFLHTTDQGEEIVGDLGNVAPPVIGEVDPNDNPDVKLSI